MHVLTQKEEVGAPTQLPLLWPALGVAELDVLEPYGGAHRDELLLARQPVAAFTDLLEPVKL